MGISNTAFENAGEGWRRREDQRGVEPFVSLLPTIYKRKDESRVTSAMPLVEPSWDQEEEKAAKEALEKAIEGKRQGFRKIQMGFSQAKWIVSFWFALKEPTKAPTYKSPL